MRKRGLKLLAVGILSIVCLTGCGQKNETENKVQQESKKVQDVSLTMWGSKDDHQLLTTMIDSFNEKYKDQVKLNVTLEAINEGECKTTIFADVSKAGDIFAFADDQLMELAAAGLIEPIANADQIKKQNSDSSIEAASINGSLYAYPMTADNGYFMYYNKKYLKEDDVKTLDKMLSVAASKNKKVTMDWSSGWYLYSFFGNTGLELGINEDRITNFCNWNAKTGDIKGTDIGNAMLTIANHAGFANKGDDGLIAGAKDGSVIAGVSGVWSANALQEIWGNDYAAVKLPTYTCAGKQVQMSSFAGYKMLGVNSYSKNSKWAAKLAEWITNQENQELRFTERGQGPSNKDAASSDKVKESPAIQALIQQSEFSMLQRVGANYWTPVSVFADSLLKKKATKANMQSLMDTMVKKITAKITDQ
ncbi:maltose/maltodextrin ABC transporter, substrate binding periplasmic protein MalE [Lachnospiraceae bacterium KM106-2]|nr:maltose/maltodextrin ABC transporter, substrate binding periplasmic protein MalE [Lachnospiraceae bacterium KM106-2]